LGWPLRVINRLRQVKGDAYYYHIKRKLTDIPRFTPGRMSVFGWDLEYVCPRALLSGLDTLVRKRWNDFRAKTENPTILDCGSNIGISVLHYKRQFPEARIVAFEPDPHIVPVLRRNLERNNASDVDIVEAAVWTRDGTAEFFCEPAEGSSLVRRQSRSVTVRTVDLRRFLVNPVDLIKMDIEGAEYQVIPGIVDNLAVVKNLIVECHIENDDMRPFSDLLRALSSARFVVGVNSYGRWLDLLRQPPKLPNDFDQYVLVAAWRNHPVLK